MEPAKLDDRELGCIDFFLFCCLLSSGLVWPTSWAILAPSWAILAPSWLHLGPILLHVGQFEFHHGSSCLHLGCILAQAGSILMHLVLLTLRSQLTCAQWNSVDNSGFLNSINLRFRNLRFHCLVAFGHQLIASDGELVTENLNEQTEIRYQKVWSVSALNPDNLTVLLVLELNIRVRLVPYAAPKYGTGTTLEPQS